MRGARAVRGVRRVRRAEVSGEGNHCTNYMKGWHCPV